MDDKALWNLIRQALAALRSYYEPVIERHIAESGLDGRAWGLLLAALTFEPDNTTPAHLMIRGPYTAAEHYLARLRAAAEAGFLIEVAPGEFQLSSKGRSWTERFIQEVRAAMDAADPLPAADGRRLASLLGQLAKNSLESPPPPDTWSIRLSFQLMPEPEPPLPYFEQAASCLSAYRDDAHLAAWQESGVSATALEVLSYLWRGQASSFADLKEHLANRGHPEQVYVDALDELRAHRYVMGSNEALRLTRAGRLFREKVEEDTDGLFYAPWPLLSQEGRSELVSILERLRDGLREKSPG